MHVDYWNHLGWYDRFSNPKFTVRQRQHSARHHSSFVYTPQFYLNGEVYRPGLIFDDVEDKINEINQKPPLANIELNLDRSSESNFEIGGLMTIKDNGQKPHAVGYLAIYQNNLTNYVIAGENKGTLLYHDFVVREFLGPFKADQDGIIEIVKSVTLEDTPDPKHIAVVAFVQNENTGDVLQALALNACR
jgi:hypothetical protein